MSVLAERCRPQRQWSVSFAHICLVMLLLCVGLFVSPPAARAVAALQPDTWVTNGQVYAVAQSGSTIYIGGDFTYVGPPTGGFASLDPGTSRPNTGMPRVDGSVSAIVPDGAGGWYIGGNFTAAGGIARRNLAHIRADATLDPDWNPNADGAVTTLAVSGATIYVGGQFTTIGGQARSYLAALDAATGAATNWNPNPGSTVRALAASGATVYAGGDFSSIGGQARSYLAALDATTGTATSWNPSADGAVYAIALSGATVYAGGDFSSIGGQARSYLAALDAATGAATNWNPSADDVVQAVALSGTTVYAGGDFSSIGGQARSYLAALDAATGAATSWNPNPDRRVVALAASGTTVYAGGAFSSIGGQARSYLAALDATTGAATSWKPSADGAVYAVAVSEDAVSAGGAFSSIGGQARNYLAALDATTGAATSWNPNAGGAVSALAVSGATVYAGGSFWTVGGQPRMNIAALDATSGAVTAWNPGANGGVTTLAASGATIYVGGWFSYIGGQARSYIAALDAGSDSATSWNPQANNLVRALAVSGTTVYAGGDFSSIGGQARNAIAALDASSGDATSWNPNASGSIWDSNASGKVNALAVSGTTVYAGGEFTHIGGQDRTNIAALDAASGSATAWNPHADYSVRALAVSGATVYAGGAFTTIGGQPRISLAALDASSGEATSWNPNAYYGVNALAASGTMVSAGGAFRSVGGQLQPYFVIFHDSVLSVSTGAATNMSESGATLNGTVNPHGDSATVTFQYTTVAGSYGQATTVAAIPSPVTGTSDTAVHANLTNLTPNTTYYYRVVATNSAGTVNGDEQSFTTTVDTTDDLFAYASDLWLDPLTIRQGDVNPGVGLNVQRRGGVAPLFNVSVNFFVGDPAAGGTPIGSGTVAALAADSQALTNKVSWNPLAGTYTLYAVIDPANQMLESDEANNVISRTITVLPPLPDVRAPRVDSFTIDDGAASTSTGRVRLNTSASDNPGGSGVAKLLYIEYEYIQSISGWTPVQSSGWLSYTIASHDYPWQLSGAAGVHYLQVWASDNAGNVSVAPFARPINYLPPLDHVNLGESRVYRQNLTAGQTLHVRLTPQNGDADLYIWTPGTPDNGEPPYVSNLAETAVDEYILTAPRTGLYQIEVYGYTDADFQLEIMPDATTSAGVPAQAAASVGGIDPNKPLRWKPAIPLGSRPDGSIRLPDTHSNFLPMVQN